MFDVILGVPKQRICQAKFVILDFGWSFLRHFFGCNMTNGQRFCEAILSFLHVEL